MAKAGGIHAGISMTNISNIFDKKFKEIHESFYKQLETKSTKILEFGDEIVLQYEGSPSIETIDPPDNEHFIMKQKYRFATRRAIINIMNEYHLGKLSRDVVNTKVSEILRTKSKTIELTPDEIQFIAELLG